ncbi:MAG: hypothetical protein K940chlam3_00943, partial [Chlamydiae bacterium]|nr:hypothetical protein [Chlamydiota bacterium]
MDAMTRAYLSHTKVHVEESKPLPLSATINTVCEKFQNGEGFTLAEDLEHINYEGTHFYGIHRDKQMKSNVSTTVKAYQAMKSHVLSLMELDPSTPVYQIVGDSAAYGHEGTQRTMEFLRNVITPEALVLYGYTGHFEKDGTRCVNASVSDFITAENRPALGNIVGYHTPAALENWNCSGPDLKHYFLVYGDDESKEGGKGTVFGDDVTSSDYFSDYLLLCEGGVQSFRQACNFLLLGKPVYTITDLRGEKTASAVIEKTGERKKYFA